MIDEISADVQILFDRALLGQRVFAFGEDGFGMHGKSDVAWHFTVSKIEVHVTQVPFSLDEYICVIGIELDDYQPDVTGHICSDKNFMYSLSELLTENLIDPSCVAYAKIEHQSPFGVTLHVDLNKLLGI